MKIVEKLKAFTLGEMLIALTVIGIVAAMILPQLIQGQKASRAKAQFATAYSTMSKAVSDMETDDISINPAGYIDPSNPQKLYNQIINYSKISFDCGGTNATPNKSICGVTTSAYKTKNGKTISTGIFDDGSFVLKNEMLVVFEYGSAGKGVLISVDINGKKNSPNKLGWDLFSFELINNDLLPVGAPGTTLESSRDTLCSDTSTSDLNGITCAYFALTDENYFKNLYRGF